MKYNITLLEQRIKELIENGNNFYNLVLDYEIEQHISDAESTYIEYINDFCKEYKRLNKIYKSL